ncbi:MAG TPA: DUF3298 and DUF4163 domain-containing protein [Pyrinomonadaceae bacterium]|nr:DUF3298 and DUF4163 domain-containing protein [Pyrinomonadaceae bacterium]
MSKRNLIALFTISFLVICLACQKRAAPTQQAQPVTTVTEQPAAAGGITPAQEVKYFRGSIGSALGLQMKLIREGQKLIGSYYYQKIGKKIDLRGTIDQANNVTLEEFDDKGKQTGVFKGLWNLDEDGLIAIAGNWTRPDGGKKAVFSLHQEPIEFSGPVEIAGKQIKENNKKLNYEIDVEYPQITGSTNPAAEKFNQQAKAVVTEEVRSFRAAMVDSAAEEIETTTGSDLGIGYTVGFANDNLISIDFGVGSYYRGAAHPNTHSRVLNFDLKNGKALRLADLFKADARYLQVVSDYCIKDLRKQSKAKEDMLDEESIQSGAGANAKNYQSWTINKQGLGINFDSYQVGPYVAGPQFVLVPYSAIKNIIKPDGPIGSFVK